MKTKLLVFATLLLLSVSMNSCEKSEASFSNMPGEEKTLVQIDIVMDGMLMEDQKLAVQLAAEDAVMKIEEAGHPSMNPRIVIGCDVIYPRAAF